MKRLNKEEELIVATNLWHLDESLWKEYFEDWEGDEVPPFDAVGRAMLYLEADLEAILMKNSEDAVRRSMERHAHGMRLLEETMECVEFDKAVAAASVRKDFEGALKGVKKGRDLSEKIQWRLSDEDLMVLAGLHKDGRMRKKIEDLLTDCNFHAECSLFLMGRYDEFLPGREK